MTKCEHCGLIHDTTCPRIKSIEYDGALIKRIEFHSPVPAFAPSQWTPGLDPSLPPYKITFGPTGAATFTRGLDCNSN